MTLKEFDVASFVKSLATEGRSSIVTPGGAVVSIARKVEGQHRIDTPYVATMQPLREVDRVLGPGPGRARVADVPRLLRAAPAHGGDGVVSVILVEGGERRLDMEPGEIDECARELYDAAIDEVAVAPAWDALSEEQHGIWRSVARHVMLGRFYACRLAEKVQQLLVTDDDGVVGSDLGPDVIDLRLLKPLLEAWRDFVAVAPHDRCDCPCVHFPGTPGECAGCNCADGAP